MPAFNHHTATLLGAASAVTVTVPHALGLGLVAFAPFAGDGSASSLALWSAAVPGALMTLLVRTRGVIYAPSTAVALLFAGMLALVMGAAPGLPLPQGLAIAGAFVALGLGIQWAIGWAGLAGLARFLPVAVTHGFAAGVSLSLMAAPLRNALGAGTDAPLDVLLAHVALATGVVLLSALTHRLHRHLPGLLIGVLGASLAAWWFLEPGHFVPADQQHAFLPLLLPDWQGAPWALVVDKVGFQLATLSMLLGIVNSLDVLVFHQSLESDHGERVDPGAVLMKESLPGMACALLGMIPASTSSSRSRTALGLTGRPAAVGPWHALAMLAIAATGHWWVYALPAACLAGALLVAGARSLPEPLLRAGWRDGAGGAESWWQAWVVALLFLYSGGALALVAGLAIATLVLMRDSATHAIRRMHLGGRLRSRVVRDTRTDAWLNQQMHAVAVFELQGIMSFGVAASVVARIRENLDKHQWVIVDASRVPAWDETGYSRLRLLAHELRERGVELAISGLRGHMHGKIDDLYDFEDLDRALEWAERALLAERAPGWDTNGHVTEAGDIKGFGELTRGITGSDMNGLAPLLTHLDVPAGELVFRAGDTERVIMCVTAGQVTLCTAPSGQGGLRLAAIGPGMVFGEMAFLNGIPRTAFAQAGPEGARLVTLEWHAFQAWADTHREAALFFMSQLARMGIRRLGTTTLELRAAME